MSDAYNEAKKPGGKHHGFLRQLSAMGRAKAGSEDGLFAHSVLSRIKNNAEALGVPLEAIGMAELDLDVLLRKRRQAA